jgi:hypothetical protein
MNTAPKLPGGLEPVAWRYKTAHTTHLCHSRLDHYFSNGEGETYIKGDGLVLQADHEASLLAKEAECEALREQLAVGPLYSTRQKAKRYEFLRDSGGGDFVVVNGMLLEGERLDAAIDSALALAAKEAK